METTYFKLLSSLAVVTLCFTLIQCSNKGLSHFSKINNPDVSETNKKEVISDLNNQDPSSQKIIISGKTIDVNKIPRNNGLVLDKEQGYTSSGITLGDLSTKKIYKSTDNGFFIITESNLPANVKLEESPNTLSAKSSIVFVNSKGKELWMKEKDLDISDCRISHNGKFVYATWVNYTTEHTEMDIYNSKGDLLKIYN